MKVVIVVMLALAVAACEACEHHRKLAAMQAAQAKAEARLRSIASLRLRQQREQALNEVRNSIYRDRMQQYQALVAPGETVFLYDLPSGHYFCNGSDVYYCPREAKCRIDPITRDWRCITEHRVIPHYIRYRPPITSRRFYPRPPIVRRPTQDKSPCRPGYKLTTDNSSCENIDECLDNPCDNATQVCHDRDGAYACVCKKGYIRTRSGSKCHDRDECVLWPKVCGIGICANTPGSFKCDCPPGYEKLGERQCRDINECEANPCSEEETCFNTWGGFSCDVPHDCPEGYLKKNSSDATVEICILTHPTLDRRVPTVITYRKILAPAQSNMDLSHPIGIINFVNGGNRQYRYTHYYSVDVEEGGENFIVRKTGLTSKSVKLEIFNRKPLVAGDELPLVLKVTDQPIPQRTLDTKLNRYIYPPHIPSTSRLVSMVIIPGIHG